MLTITHLLTQEFNKSVIVKVNPRYEELISPLHRKSMIINIIFDNSVTDLNPTRIKIVRESQLLLQLVTAESNY